MHDARIRSERTSRLGATAFAAALVVLLAASRARAAEPSDLAAEPKLPFFSLGARFGAALWGTGAQKNECSGPCASFAPDDVAYLHLPAFAIGIDALFGAFDRFRFGVGALFVPRDTIQLAGAGDSFVVGSDLAVDAVAEGVLRAAPRIWILPRIQGGPIVLFPGGDFRTTLDAVNRDYCAGRAEGCDSLTGAYTGWNLAAGGGVLWSATERIRPRADISFQYYAVPLYTVSASLASEPIRVSERLSGGRIFLTMGGEFF